MSDLEAGWSAPPPSARLRAYWWWLNGNVTKAAITRDLEEMAAKGFGGAFISDANGAELNGNDPVPHGPTFLSAEWRELYKHALREAARLGLEMGLNIQSGWNLGGPMVAPEDAVKLLVWSETRVLGGATVTRALPEPKHPHPFYSDIAVLAVPARSDGARPTLQNLGVKTMQRRIPGPQSGHSDTLLLRDDPDAPGEADATAGQIVDLTAKMGADGMLRWDAPPGRWDILRLGYTVSGVRGLVFRSSEGWGGFAIDPFDAGAFNRYWDAVVEPLIADAGPLAGKTLRYLFSDSWDVDPTNWTPTLRAEFVRRRGYDPLPWLVAMAGRIVNSRSETNRFLHDFRKTLGDLAVDNHLRVYRERAQRHGLAIQTESGGPDPAPVDGQRCLTINDVPMGEFWATSWKGRVTDHQRFHMKQPASAAHTSGRTLVAGEGFTTIGPQWQETLWDNLKPAFDRACTEGLNRLVWHEFVCSPVEMGVPGQQFHAGTHLNPNVTWWSRSAAFFAYLNRCQFMLQQGQFVADALYYYGDHVPNLGQLRSADPARVGAGYDYDEITEEGLLTRVSVKDGRLVLPDGMSYRVLVLPERPAIPLPVLRRVRELVAAGATVLGPRPTEAAGLAGHPQSDRELQGIAAGLWQGKPAAGRVMAARTAREVLLADGVRPDFEWTGGSEKTVVDYIHRREGETDIYFIANRDPLAAAVRCVFRVANKVPELWDPVTGTRRVVDAFEFVEGRTRFRIDLPPHGSMFVVFRTRAERAPVAAERLVRVPAVAQTLSGPWQVAFDPKWGGPAAVTFDELVSWTKRPEPGIRHYSGEATYRTTFDRPSLRAGETLTLDLGAVRELAEVRLNGRSLGILWSPPFRVELPGDLPAAGNRLEITVVNFWPNRLIGDAELPPEKRLTRTNIRVLTKDVPLMESGLFGPVTLQTLADGK